MNKIVGAGCILIFGMLITGSCFIHSSFLVGQALASSCHTTPFPLSNDISIGPGQVVALQNTYFIQDGNITINGGTLYLNNSVLVFSQDINHRYRLTVSNGGKLLAYNSTVTVSGKQISPYLLFEFSCTNALIKIDAPNNHNSYLTFPGWFNATGSTIYLNNTVLNALSSLPAGIDTDENNDAPRLKFINSKIVFADSRVENYYTSQNSSRTYMQNLTISGPQATLVAINTFFDANWKKNWSQGRKTLLLTNSAVARLYGVTFNENVTGGLHEESAILVTDSAAAYIYRWLKIEPKDMNGYPVADTTVSISSNVFDPMKSVVASFNNPYNNPDVWHYLNRTIPGYRYGVSGSDGVATHFGLSDIINSTTMPNSQYAGSYNLGASYRTYQNNTYLSLAPYPALSPGDNIYRVSPRFWQLNLATPLDLTVEGVHFTPDYIVALNQTFSIDFTVRNTGSITVNTVVRIYETAGSTIHNITLLAVTLFSTSARTFSQPWQTTVYGTHIIYIEIDPQNVIVETDENNNIVSSELYVLSGFDLIVGERENETFSITASMSPYKLKGFVVVKKDGVLRLEYATLHILAERNNQFAIILRDSGALYTVGAEIKSESNYDVPVLFFNRSSATFDATSTQSGIKLHTNSDKTELRFSASVISGNITAQCRLIAADNSEFSRPQSIAAYRFYANNTVFNAPIGPFTGDMKAELVASEIRPEARGNIKVFENAEVLIYRLAIVRVGDGLKQGLSNATVEFYTYDTNITVATARTDLQGRVSVRLQSDMLNRTGAYYFGNYRLLVKYAGFVVPLPGLHISLPEYPRNIRTSITWINMTMLLPDLVVEKITFTPDTEIPVGTTVTISATIKNSGNTNATNVNVKFYAGETAVFSSQLIDNLPAGRAVVLSSNWSSVLGVKSIIVWADPHNNITELNDGKANNRLAKAIKIVKYPDLVLNSITFSVRRLVHNKTVTITANVTNLGSKAWNITVQLYLDNSLIADNFTSAPIPELSARDFRFTWKIEKRNPTNSTPEVREVKCVILRQMMPRAEQEATLADNVKVVSVTVNAEADLVVFAFLVNGGSETTVMTGTIVNLTATFWNCGGSDATAIRVKFYDFRSDSVLWVNNTNLSVGERKNISVSLKLIAPGLHRITVFINPPEEGMRIPEFNYSNNELAVNVTVLAWELTIAWSPLTQTTYIAGKDYVLIEGTVYLKGTTEGVSGVTVLAELKDAANSTVSKVSFEPTDRSGKFMGGLPIPVLSGGEYIIYLSAPNATSPSQRITVVPLPAAEFNWWIIVAIVILAAAAAGGFSAYRMLVAKGRMVECGECGSIIPEAVKKCPRCGILFEVATAKCSNCLSWIPANAKECPECGVMFIVPKELTAEGIEAIYRKEYKLFVEKARAKAKAELGKEYSERAFWRWWRRQSDYMSYEDWVTVQEEKKKAPTKLCPQCSTPNPLSATVCAKCGSKLEKEEKVPEKEVPKPPVVEEKKPEERKCVKCGTKLSPDTKICPVCGMPQEVRRVIKKPVTGKVIYKRVVKPPPPAAGEPKPPEKT